MILKIFGKRENQKSKNPYVDQQLMQKNLNSAYSIGMQSVSDEAMEIFIHNKQQKQMNRILTEQNELKQKQIQSLSLQQQQQQKQSLVSKHK